MTVCPVCEHAQPVGAECEVCGKDLGAASGADLAPTAVDGLEPTRYPPIDPPPERLAELEPTRHAPARSVVPDPVPDLEATRASPVDVDADATPDLERTSAPIPGDGPTPMPAVLVCRYCRTPAAPAERVCGRCGMRLPLLAAPPAEAAPPPHRCSCGAAVRGGLCPSCGARPRS